MRVELLERAVKVVTEEIEKGYRPRNWARLSESQLFYELVACILASQVSFEMALAAAKAIRREGLINEVFIDFSFDVYVRRIARVLSLPLFSASWDKPRKYRFPNSKAKSIAETARRIYGNDDTVKKMLRSCETAEQARQALMENASGVGPKQASMFLRNIGFSTEVAIIDTHVVRYMDVMSIVDTTKMIYCARAYNEYESLLRKYSLKLGHSMATLDQAIWVVMRVANKAL